MKLVELLRPASLQKVLLELAVRPLPLAMLLALTPDGKSPLTAAEVAVVTGISQPTSVIAWTAAGVKTTPKNANEETMNRVGKQRGFNFIVKSLCFTQRRGHLPKIGDNRVGNERLHQ